MRPVKTHSFRGRRYNIRFDRQPLGRGHLGVCDAPTAGRNKTIVIRPNLSDRDKLDTAVHEALHACYWDMDEEAVNEGASDIAKFLWRLGYRDKASEQAQGE